MHLTLIRSTCTRRETLGLLLIDSKLFCSTLEPPVIPNQLHPKGAIPTGCYKLTITFSPKFGRLLPLVNDVQGFSGIRIHAGNNFKHTAGCILVGRPRDSCLTDSRETEQQLISTLQTDTKHEHSIEITTAGRYLAEHSDTPDAVRLLHTQTE